MSLVRVLSLVLLAACELQPPPKQSAAPAPAPTAEPPGPPAPTDAVRPAPPPSAGSPAIQVTDDCVKVGAHVANVIIANASDPGQRSILEQERAKMVRATAEACTTQAWSDAAARCYLDTRTPAEIKECEKKFTPPRPPTRAPVVPPPEGAGEMRPEPGAVAPGTPPAQPGTEPAPPAGTQPARPGRRPTTTRPTRPAQPGTRPARSAGTRPAGQRPPRSRMQLKPPVRDTIDDETR